IWSGVLGIAADKISINDHFFRLGGHSLKAVRLISRIQKELNVKVPLDHIFKYPDIKGLALCIGGLTEKEYAPIPAAEKRDYYPLSSAQKRLYLLQQMDLEGTTYNMPVMLPLDREIKKDKLQMLLKRLILRHENLRTSFQVIAETPVQRVHDDVSFEIEYFGRGVPPWSPLDGNHSGNNDSGSRNNSGSHRGLPLQIQRDFIRPFDLSQAPLMRSALVRGNDGRFTWLVDIHHIVSDGISMTILEEDFISLYNGEDLQPSVLPIQYKDFALWQKHLFESDRIKSQWNYWLDLYGKPGGIPSLQLPTDYKRPGVFTFAGHRCDFKLETADAVGFNALTARCGGTLYMNLLTALNTLLYVYTRQTDIIIGSGVAGRPHDDLQRTMGMFVNTLAMRNHPGAEKTYEAFLKEVIRQSIHAFENQDIQFEGLVEKLDIKRDTSRNPLFDICMTVQNFRQSGGRATLALADGISHPLEYKGTAAKFDMTFFIDQEGEDISISVEYYKAIFNQGTVQRMAAHFTNIIRSVIQNPLQQLKDIEVISPDEKRQLLLDFNDTGRESPGDKTLPELFREQSQLTPDHIAVVGLGARQRMFLTYRELNRRAGQLAHELKKKGVLPDTIVAIMVERSIEMIVGIFGILKSGGAYLPIDPDYPQGRIDYMLKDSRTKIIVTNGLKVIKIKPDEVNRFPSQQTNKLTNQPTNLAYIIYTSGSTGKSKGNLTTHRNVIRVVRDNNYIHLTPGDRILQLSNYAFDGSVFDIYGALLNGSTLVLIQKEEIMEVDRLASLIEREK
ncbi:MAG: AMP-binding protein, partial [bacterium]|nr:AMP-binding protein [bacterium]